MRSKHSSCRTAKMLTCCTILLIVFIQISSASSNVHVNNELGSIHQEIGLLRDENKNQNMEIGLLKEKIESQDRTIHKKIIAELNKLIIDGEDHSPSRAIQRGKRPARLLPEWLLHGDRRNDKKTQADNQPQKFYGPPTNCSDLSSLGYTLNGYYLVKSDANEGGSLSNNPVPVYCAFKQPGNFFNQSAVEKQISYSIKSNSSDVIIKSTESGGKPWTTSGAPRRRASRANLVNLLGKCAAVADDVNGKPLLLSTCDSVKGMQWSWNETSLGSGIRHLCNAYGKCAASRCNSRANSLSLIQWDHNVKEEGQKFTFIEVPNPPGFYLIKNDFGQCLSVSMEHGQQQIHVTDDCNSNLSGQLWTWTNL